MASYFTRVSKKAWADTLRDCGFRDRRSAIMKFVWIGIAFGVAYFSGGVEAFADKLGTELATVVALIAFFVLIFVWNFIVAPSELQKEADDQIETLKLKLDNRKARQQAMARLWALRAEGTNMRNEKISRSEVANWQHKYEDWRTRVLSEAEKVSLNFRAWLETLDRIRPGPSDLPQAATPDHNRLRSVQSEILLRMQEFLQAEMLHRDVVSER
jgi:hypothetical protein